MNLRVVIVALVSLVFVSCTIMREDKNIFLSVRWPGFGEINLGEVDVMIIPSPIIKLEEVAISGKHKSEWEATIKRRWLALEVKSRPTIEFTISELPPFYAGYSYSAYVSSKSSAWGRLARSELSDVLFRSFTINIEASEDVKIETRRDALAELGRSKSEVRLRAKLVRIETSALGLLNPETKKVDFLDFYVSEIEFLN